MYCAECEQLVKKEKEDLMAEYLRLKTIVMVERAITIMDRQAVDMYEYKEAIDVVRNHAIEHPEKYMSSHEVIAAIVLIYNEIETKVQYKIKNHTVDFCLPTLKVVLEVDGFMHDHAQARDGKRDIDIRATLGPEWEVVRIPTQYIEQNASLLVEAIKTIKQEKRKVRRENNGIIPEWYSKREKAHYKKCCGEKTVKNPLAI
jgi:very-short-patch-repair endonuclease